MSGYKKKTSRKLVTSRFSKLQRESIFRKFSPNVLRFRPWSASFWKVLNDLAPYLWRNKVTLQVASLSDLLEQTGATHEGTLDLDNVFFFLAITELCGFTDVRPGNWKFRRSEPKCGRFDNDFRMFRLISWNLKPKWEFVYYYFFHKGEGAGIRGFMVSRTYL